MLKPPDQFPSRGFPELLLPVSIATRLWPLDSDRNRRKFPAFSWSLHNQAPVQNLSLIHICDAPLGGEEPDAIREMPADSDHGHDIDG